MKKIEATEPHPNCSISWDDITVEEVNNFEKVLENAQKEQEMQNLFESCPKLLVQHLAGGHGRWCVPQKRFGAEFIPDFIIGEKSSVGYEWYGVELENPNVKLFFSNGDPSRKLVHAMKQVIDWRGWLEDNIDYARRPRQKNGLGLPDISNDLTSYIIIGQRNDDGNIENENSYWRKYVKSYLNIEIHTYNWLIDRAVIRLKNLSE